MSDDDPVSKPKRTLGMSAEQKWDDLRRVLLESARTNSRAIDLKGINLKDHDFTSQYLETLVLKYLASSSLEKSPAAPELLESSEVERPNETPPDIEQARQLIKNILGAPGGEEQITRLILDLQKQSGSEKPARLDSLVASSSTFQPYPVSLVEKLDSLCVDRVKRRAKDSELDEEIRRIVHELGNYRPPQRGDVVLGARLVEIIGAGNFGNVWRAKLHDSDREVAIKVFQPEKFGLQLSLHAFRRGVEAMERLSNAPGRPPTVIELLKADEARVMFSMTLANRIDLSQACQGWQLDTKLRFFRDVCGAVKFAHSHGILHRDIKPENILVTEDLAPILTDFDIADLLYKKTLSSKANGTILYAAPEQLQGTSDRRFNSDVYSLGRILHFLLLENDPPFAVDAVPKLEDLSGSPQGLVRIVRKCTLRNPDIRYQSVDDLLLDLARYREPKDVGADEPSSDISHPPESIANRLLKIMLASDAGRKLAALGFHSPAEIIRRSTLDELLGSQVELLVGQNANSMRYGGPPYGIGTKAIVRFRIGYEDLRSRLIGAISELGKADEKTKLAWDIEHIIEMYDATGGALELRLQEESTNRADVESSFKEMPIAETDHSELGERGGLSLLQFLRLAITAVPAVKYALGVGGVVSVLAIIRLFGIDYRVAVVGGIAMFVMMAILLVFARTTTLKDRAFRTPALALTWASLVLFVTASFAMMSSVFFNYPVPLRVWLVPAHVSAPVAGAPAVIVSSRVEVTERARGGEGSQDTNASALSQTDNGVARPCPEKCCPNGRACEDLDSCVERAKCTLCRDGKDPAWSLSLARLDFPNSYQWQNVKVCLHAHNKCNQVCVNAEKIGTNLADFTCPYRPEDLKYAAVTVLGKSPGTDVEVRIAEKQQVFGPLNTTALCAGLRFTALEARKDKVQGVLLTANPAK